MIRHISLSAVLLDQMLFSTCSKILHSFVICEYCFHGCKNPKRSDSLDILKNPKLLLHVSSNITPGKIVVLSHKMLFTRAMFGYSISISAYWIGTIISSQIRPILINSPLA